MLYLQNDGSEPTFTLIFMLKDVGEYISFIIGRQPLLFRGNMRQCILENIAESDFCLSM